MTPNLTLNLGPALGLHVAAGREGQPADELRPGDRPADLRRPTAASRSARSTSPYYKGCEPRLGAAWKVSDRLVVRGGYGISQFMEGTGANLRLPMNPPFFFESSVNYDRTTGAGIARPRASPAWSPARRPRATSAPTTPTCVRSSRSSGTLFVEYQLTSSMSAQVGYVGHHAEHLVAPVEGNQALPGVGDPTTWASKTVASAAVRGAAARHDDRDDRVARRQPLPLAAGQRAPAHEPRPRVPRVVHAGQGAAPTTAASTACSAARACRASPARPRAPTGRTPTTPRPSGGRRSTTCGTTSSCRRTLGAAVRQGPHVRQRLERR